MNDKQWRTCRDVGTLFEYLATKKGKESKADLDLVTEAYGERKVVLFAVACCRLVWDRLVPTATRNLVTAAEQYVDGEASEDDLGEAVVALLGLEGPEQSEELSHREKWLSGSADILIVNATGHTLTLYGDIRYGDERYGEFMDNLEGLQGGTRARRSARARREDSARQADLLRDIFGNPFRPPRPVDPKWLKWNGGAVRKLAASIYEGRRFGDLPILADALEEAGCTDADLLGHCRGPGPHARGCWALDGILGRG